MHINCLPQLTTSHYLHVTIHEIVKCPFCKQSHLAFGPISLTKQPQMHLQSTQSNPQSLHWKPLSLIEINPTILS